MMNTRENTSRHSGFTLIELLVVIAIIAILAALLLPALAAVKNRSQMVTDINNCKQMMLSAIMYGNNSNEHLPQPGWQMNLKNWAADALQTTGNPPGIMELAPGGGNATTYSTYYPIQVLAFQKGQLGTYIQNVKLLQCPADILNANYYLRQEYITSYVWNGAAVRFEAPGAQNDTVKFSDPELFGSRILIWENDEILVNNSGQWNDFSNYPDQGISKRHGDGAMIATLDGGATRMDMRDFYQLGGTYPTGNPPGGAGSGKPVANPGAPNDLWWFP